MNYKKIYLNLIKKSRSCNRVKTDTEYFEKHHIVPTFMFKNNKRSSGRSIGHFPGNHDNPRNIVLLTAKEHFIAHLLLCKIYQGTRYEQGCFCSLFMMISTKKNEVRRRDLNRGIYMDKRINSKFYKKMRMKGLTAISISRKNQVPCIDSKTGKSVGCIRNDDPKYLSGEFIHHSKGSKCSDETRKKIKDVTTGPRNPRFCGITNDEILSEFLLLSKKMNQIPLISFFFKYWNLKFSDRPFPKHLTQFRFNRGKDLFRIASENTGLPIPSKYAKHFSKLNVKDFL